MWIKNGVDDDAMLLHSFIPFACFVVISESEKHWFCFFPLLAFIPLIFFIP